VVAFDYPTSRVRCALALRAALAALGVTIRAGLHTGECQVSGANLAGLAVHVAARECAAANGGELLVTATVHDLMAGAAVALEDRGAHELKGVPGQWRLFAVGGS
jgi:class 3 adenylate cyclase